MATCGVGRSKPIVPGVLRIGLFGLTLLGSGGCATPAQPTLPQFAGQVPTLAPLLREVTPAVVNIAVRGRIREQNPLFQDPFFRQFFDFPQQIEREVQAAGSGVIVDAPRGYVLTNNHLIEHAVAIQVTTKDNRRLSAKLIGRDPEADIAVLQIQGSTSLAALPFGDSDKLQVGDFVLAIGNPFGIGQTVTSGIVSALGRSGLGIEGYENFIQTDAFDQSRQFRRRSCRSSRPAGWDQYRDPDARRRECGNWLCHTGQQGAPCHGGDRYARECPTWKRLAPPFRI